MAAVVVGVSVEGILCLSATEEEGAVVEAGRVGA